MRQGSILFLLALSALSLTAYGADAETPNYSEQLIAEAKAKKLASSEGWLKLGHYQKRLFGGYKSEADGSGFFLAENGKKDPEAELESAIRALFQPLPTPDKKEEHPLCRFPARYRWLKKELSIDERRVPAVKCAGLADWRARVDADSATIVFSSYYLNNPSSAFGHSFLRLNKPKSRFNGERHELLDHGINYAANTTTENPVLYAIYGMVGAFRGTFTAVPYYYKVREYNDYEARDLWGYDLNLTRDDVAMLVDHLWELGQTHFDYFYFTENCSYHILTAVEAVRPDLKITDRLPFYIIPSDTIKAVNETPGLVASIHYRPSIRAQFRHRLEKLSGKNEAHLVRLVEKRELSTELEALPAAERAEVLDAAIDHVEMAHPEILARPESDAGKWKQRLLLARAGTQIQGDEPVITPPEAPHSGHGSRRLGLEYGDLKDSGKFVGAQMRFALHDQLDPGTGYPEGSQLEFFNLKARYEIEDKKVSLEDFAFFRISSLNPLTDFDKKISWRMHLGASRARDRNCDRCLMGVFEAAPGLAKKFDLGVSVLPYAYLDLETSYSPSFSGSNFRVGVGPEAGILFGVSRSVAATVRGGYRHYAFAVEPKYYFLGASFRAGIGRKLAFGGEALSAMGRPEAAVNAFYYF